MNFKSHGINLLASNQDNKLTDSLKNLYGIYSIIGGYPAVVETFIRTKDFNKALVKIKEIVSIFCQESLYYFEDINDVKLNSRLYFRDLGVTSYFLNKINASKSDTDGLINETFVYNCLYNHLNDSTGLLPNIPTFATLNNGELDFVLKSKYDNKLYGIEVKTGKNIGKRINKALELNKIDFAINVKGNTHGGFNEAERKYTIPIYLFSKFKFDLGEEEIDGTEALKK